MMRYPASTALALASAAHSLRIEAWSRSDKKKAAKYDRMRDRHLERFGGLFATGEGVEAQRAAMAVLRSDPAARAEAQAAVAKLNPPKWGWIVRGFGQTIPMIEPVNLAAANEADHG